MNLSAGGNCPLPTSELIVRVQTSQEMDISAYLLDAKGKVSGDQDMIFYGQPYSKDGMVKLVNEGVNSTFVVNLNTVSHQVEKIAFACTSSTVQNVGSLSRISIQVEQHGTILATGNVDLSGRSEAALILGELYRRNNEWKFRFISQGFNGGLKPLAEFFGVDVEDTPATDPVPFQPEIPPAPKVVNLSKISLTKTNPKISLAKRSDYGLIKVNLNWNQGSTNSSGFFGSIFGSSSNAIDLDLGCFVRLKDGTQEVIQALGGYLGELHNQPYVKLLGDDRTGVSTSGEWLHINGKYWQQIDEVLIFAFIYKGVPDWTATDGVVTLHIPNEPPIETRLTEGGRSNGMCGIARLVNRNGTISVERINRYFSGHRELDHAFDWGFSWTSGRK